MTEISYFLYKLLAEINLLQKELIIPFKVGFFFLLLFSLKVAFTCIDGIYSRVFFRSHAGFSENVRVARKTAEIRRSLKDFYLGQVPFLFLLRLTLSFD